MADFDNALKNYLIWYCCQNAFCSHGFCIKAKINLFTDANNDDALTQNYIACCNAYSLKYLRLLSQLTLKNLA